MESSARYEILDTIATGEFATVSRARDRELGREVAVKQIHAQYLADPRQLARYWQEAQLLASLQHANILTIYDVVRSRGWLILELMKGSLKPVAEGDPMDLDRLQLILVNCLTGLHFLHTNGVIHGDIKPSNILVAPPHRIKLGDFGLARRANNEGGSLLKGTTKYMAPELLSAQFGTVGPASDLYSLGFTAYELMVGAQFESLLPALSTFGRNRQMAWMMWHSTADVNLPDIKRVLEGVPDDLTHVIQRLIAKDQSQRYHSAQEALRDLQGSPSAVNRLAVSPDPETEAEAATAARRKKRVRVLSMVAGGIAVVLCTLIVMLMVNRPKKSQVVVAPQTIKGTISEVLVGSREFGVAPEDGGAVKLITTRDQKDQEDIIFVNGKRHLFEELAQGDLVEITRTVDPVTRRIVREIRATRSGTHAEGKLISRDDTERTIVVESSGEASSSGFVKVFVPKDLKKILMNGSAVFQEKPVTFASLNPGDRLKVQYEQESSANVASRVEAVRQVELQGVLAENFDGRLLSINKDNRQVVKLPFASQYVITLNGQPIAKPSSLKQGDHVKIKHDIYISELAAQRTFGSGGLVQQIRYEPPQTLSVVEDGGQKMTYFVSPQCKITLGDEPVALETLRPGDRVAIKHEAIDATSQSAIPASEIAAERSTDATRWALIVAVQNYDDKRLSPLSFPLADAALLTDVLSKRYRIPAEQLRVFNDPSAVTLEREVPDFLKRIGSSARLIVYYVGHACKDNDGQVFLAPKDFRLDHPAVNGRALQWLVDLLEDCSAKEKFLLLDGSHSDAGAHGEPSSSEMIRALKPQPNRALLRKVTAVASCQKGQHGLDLAKKGHGLFAWCLAEGYGGAADVNHDTLVEPTELFAYLKKGMPVASSQGAQTPELFLPDDRPPRLTAAAKTAIRKLASHTDQVKVNVEEASQDYDSALQASGDEPEARLMLGLVLLKKKDRERATQHFETVKSAMPDQLLPYAALAWLKMEKRAFPAAVRELVSMIEKIRKPEPLLVPDPFEWAGQLCGYAQGVGDKSRQLDEAVAALESAVSARGQRANELFAKGRQRSMEIVADFDRKINEATDEAESGTQKVNRKQLARYSDFPISQFKDQLLLHLDE